MNVIPLQVFVSLGLATLSLLLFAFSARQRNFEQSHRLSLLPLADDTSTKSTDKS